MNNWWLSIIGVSIFAAHCGAPPNVLPVFEDRPTPTVDVPNPRMAEDAVAVTDVMDRDVPDPVAPDVPQMVERDVPTRPSDSGVLTGRAGLPCVDDVSCGVLTCDRSVRDGICTGMCAQGSAMIEAGMCGGAGSTCVGIGDGPTQANSCTKSCRPTMNSGCRPGYVCTGFWYTHAGAMPDSPGCMPQCSSDAHCNAGEHCNVRTGACGAAGFDANALADGMPCTPPAMGQPSPCRGVCFTVNPMDLTHGVCGSFIDLSQTMACPDDPMVIGALGRAGADNKGLCLFRNCSDRLCCPAGMFCEAQLGVDGRCSPIDDPGVPNVVCTAP